MKLVILVELFPPKWLAGTEIATYQMAEHLAQRGHEVHVITSLDDGLPEESYEKGFYIHRLPRVRVRFVDILVFWIEVIKMIWKISPDIVHAQSLSFAVPSLISKRILKIPYVIWGQGSDVYLPSWLIKLTSKINIKNADSVFALTKDMEKAMQAIYGREIVVVPNGIEFKEHSDKQPVHDIEGPKGRILFVGRLHPIKGVQYLLCAMRTVHRDIPEAKLMIVGDGEERKNLENLTDSLGLRECVEFVGKVPHERIAGYMDRSDILVLPSLSESFGIVNLEAMACGLPIVATRVGGIPDIIEEGVNGFLVEAKNPDEIADRTLKLIRNAVLRGEMSAQNREKARQYTWDTVAGTLEGIYQNLLESSE